MTEPTHFLPIMPACGCITRRAVAVDKPQCPVSAKEAFGRRPGR